jgi:hypothetical protein
MISIVDLRSTAHFVAEVAPPAKPNHPRGEVFPGEARRDAHEESGGCETRNGAAVPLRGARHKESFSSEPLFVALLRSSSS